MLGENAQYILTLCSKVIRWAFFNSYVYSFTISLNHTLRFCTLITLKDIGWPIFITDGSKVFRYISGLFTIRLEGSKEPEHSKFRQVYSLLVNQICLLLYCEVEPCYGNEALSSFISLSSRFSSIKFHDTRMYVCRIILDSFKSVFV